MKKMEPTIPQSEKDRVVIVIINGLGGHGKSSFCDYFHRVVSSKKLNTYTAEESSVDCAKEVAAFCGWRGEKTTKDREFLHEIKAALTKWRNIPNNTVLDKIDSLVGSRKFDNIGEIFYQNAIIFVNIRESTDINDFIETANQRGYHNIRKLLVANTNKETNEVDELVNDVLYNTEYDDVIQNDDTLEDLRYKAEFYYDLLTGMFGFNEQ